MVSCRLHKIGLIGAHVYFGAVWHPPAAARSPLEDRCVALPGIVVSVTTSVLRLATIPILPQRVSTRTYSEAP